jgi:hypothetical protein
LLQRLTTDYPLGCTNRATYGVTGDVLKVEGEHTLSFLLDNVSYRHAFLVCELPTRAAGILGTYILKSRQATVNLER